VTFFEGKKKVNNTFCGLFADYLSFNQGKIKDIRVKGYPAESLFWCKEGRIP